MKDEYSRIEEIFFYIKEQFEKHNFGRVIRDSERILNSEFQEFHFKTFEFRAIALLEEHRNDEAVETYQNAIKEYPKDFSFRMNMVMTMLDVGRFVEAEKELLWLNENFPKNYEVFYSLGSVAMELRSFVQAIERFEQLLSFWNFDFSAMINIALAKMELGQYDEALDLFTILVRLVGTDTVELVELYNNWGYVYSRKGDFAKAKECLEVARHYWPDNTYVNDNLGFALANLGDFEQGMGLINTSIELDEMNSYAFKNRAKLYMMKQKWKLAKKDLDKAKYLGYEAGFGEEVNRLLREVEMHLA